MGQNRKFVVWEWVDAERIPVYVGWGRQTRCHPSFTLWDMRMVFNSDLNMWLRKHEHEPERIDHNGIVHFYRQEASNVAASLRTRYQKKGRKLLDPRPWGTKAGGGSARQVMAPDMTIYSSVRQAAVDVGVNPCTITRWCQTRGSGWAHLN